MRATTYFVFGLVSVTMVFGCGSGGSSGSPATGGSGAKGGSGGAGATGGTGATGGGTGATGGTGGGTGGTGASGGSAGASCVLSDVPVVGAPVDAYLLLDQSGSMSDVASGATTKFAAVASGIQQYVSAATGTSLGLQYFPLQTATCPTACASDNDCGACGPCQIIGSIGVCAGSAADSCTASDYATPDVEVAALPGNASAFSSSLSTHTPSGASTLSAALQGGIQHMQAWAGSHPDHTPIVIVATDGAPAECETSLTNIDALAQAGATATPNVTSFMIGIGALSAGLDPIADAGGSGKAVIVDTTADVATGFRSALQQIRSLAEACSFVLPSAPSGQSFDSGKLNLGYTPNTGSRTLVPQVASPADCPAAGLAWHYDVPASPSRVVLCPSACTTVAVSGGQLDAEYGCPTTGG